MKTRLLIFALTLLGASALQAQVYQSDFTPDKKVKEGFTKITPTIIYNDELGYGYDLGMARDGKTNQPFFFSVNVPEIGRAHV